MFACIMIGDDTPHPALGEGVYMTNCMSFSTVFVMYRIN
jgi:hypothetical protein